MVTNLLFTEETHNYEHLIVEYVDNNNGSSLNDIHMHIDKNVSKSSISS